ncbi:Similar to Morphogenesis-related protein MSB1; acc. no. P21339 [Pyronema omphalodes CBS 100304]|uniref:Similar to Morphogenesis-related protein MSB1 acc. no. P21339 n=1 Tax=Pyronema omphalodes (strain CBS 100304) TaxID=1076935 RepID=U4LF75_PYROM|nr:Similar to Morphogenesis-related protein MSB1; acc. no. P21339 [Pyronema omphalodes CBS 100304]
MPAFLNRVFKREHGHGKKNQLPAAETSTQPKQTDGWLRTEVSPDEVQELLRGCTNEMKARGLLTPFILLPYRPNSDPCAARTLIRNFFNAENGPMTGAQLQQELRLTEPEVLCSALKWCWSRLPGGVVTWDVYELFRHSSMARDSFATFIPISAESEARSKIIFDYFDLLSAIAAHGKHNGLGGLKLSRLAGWWAFEHVDTGYGFEGGYATWTSAADACCHLFFAYLRSLSPADPTRSVSLLPTSLRALLASVDYPPVTPPQFQTRTVRVVMTVDKVSPSPFSLLRRAKNIEYDNGDRALKVFTEFEDPVKALTDECRRVLKCISSTGQSTSGVFKLAANAPEASWSRFQDIGFSGLVESESDEDDVLQSEAFARRRISSQQANVPTPTGTPLSRDTMSRDSPMSRDRDDFMEIARPTTPSWADFMDAGFGERDNMAHHGSAAPTLLPPDKVLPPIETADRLKSSASNRKLQVLEPGELESVTPMDVDDVFWWVWMSSLAGEETTVRKAVFGRCALVETTVQGAKWLVVEEKVRGAAVMTESPVAVKKERRWRAKLRRKSIGAAEAPAPTAMKPFNASLHTASRTNIGPDQTAKIQAAAAALRQANNDEAQARSGGKPREHVTDAKTNSIFTLQPVIMSEASPAMKWANRYDRDNADGTVVKAALPAPQEKQETVKSERDLPAIPQEENIRPAPVKARSMLDIDTALPAAAKSLPASPVEPRKPTTAPASPAPSPAPAALPTPTNSGRSSPAMNKRVSVAPPAVAAVVPGKKVSRLRAIFGMKAEGAETPVTLTVPTETRDALGRKKSIKKDKGPNAPLTPSVADAPVSPMIPEAPLTPAPPAEEHPAFSTKFDQGPLDDVPAFVPEESPEVSDIETPTKEEAVASEDRWAQIRRNAAERAKAAEKETETEEETAKEEVAEETIESRVARIKAKVAQLTAEGQQQHRV